MTTDGPEVPPRRRSTAVTERHLGRRRTPYVILAGIEVFAAGLCIVFAIPGLDITYEPRMFLTIGACLLAAAATTWWLLPRLPRDLGIDVGLVFGYLIAGAAQRSRRRPTRARCSSVSGSRCTPSPPPTSCRASVCASRCCCWP